MNQLIEGIDNEIVFIFFFITILLAVVIPLYVMKPSRSLQERSQQEINPTTTNTTNRTTTTSSTTTTNSTGEYVDGGTNNGIFVEQDTHDVPHTRMPEPEPFARSQTPSGTQTSNGGETISIRVLHQETNRQMDVSNETKLSELKQQCFPEEFAAHKSIRMIYAGRIVSPDTMSLRELGIGGGSVLHCVVSEHSNTNGRTNEPATGVPNDLDISDYFMLLVGVTLIGTWAIFITSSSVMSTTSIVILGILTVFFVGMTFYN